jgi:hypothetical protein
LPQADRSETARVLREKGNEDAAVVWELLENSRIADSIIGFHTQQARGGRHRCRPIAIASPS